MKFDEVSTDVHSREFGFIKYPRRNEVFSLRPQSR